MDYEQRTGDIKEAIVKFFSGSIPGGAVFITGLWAMEYRNTLDKSHARRVGFAFYADIRIMSQRPRHGTLL